ncbi:APC family, aromatic amino acid transporter [Salmonella enterica subsp. enterica]|uniref:APC family, aromatic amino acid transporter n=1 Tax=Salmonella enterica I TaxID=59201 RepID=A0A379WEM2_SALET|nr:APC family, aromatic amino acid transporter [Salmonella enterica subsp. enterica]
MTALCVLLNYLAPESAFGLLMALVVSALVINWAMISLAHMMFRRAKQQQGVKPASRPCFIRSAMFSACCLWRRY